MTTISAHILDARGVYAYTVEIDPAGAQPAGAVYAELPDAIEGFARMWLGGAWVQVAHADVPPMPEPIELVADLRITRLAFRNRFTQQEKVMLELAALDDPSAEMAVRMKSASLRAYLKDVEAAKCIDLARDDLGEGVRTLETMQLLTTGRASQILSTTILEVERFDGA